MLIQGTSQYQIHIVSKYTKKRKHETNGKRGKPVQEEPAYRRWYYGGTGWLCTAKVGGWSRRPKSHKKQEKRKVVAVAWGYVNRFYLLLLVVGLVPCYPVCRLLLAFLRRGFSTPPPLPTLFFFGCQASGLLGAPSSSFFSSTCHLAMNRSAASWTLRYIPLARLLLPHGPTVSRVVSTPNCRGETSVGPSSLQ